MESIQKWKERTEDRERQTIDDHRKRMQALLSPQTIVLSSSLSLPISLTHLRSLSHLNAGELFLSIP